VLLREMESVTSCGLVETQYFGYTNCHDDIKKKELSSTKGIYYVKIIKPFTIVCSGL
jgi:hypothetical protein